MYDRKVVSPRPEAKAVRATPMAATNSVFALATVIKLATVKQIHMDTLRLEKL